MILKPLANRPDPYSRFYDYAYVPGRPLERHGLEQQAEIARHVFLMRRGRRLDRPTSLARLEAVLAFAPDP